MSNIEEVKKLRNETGASPLDCKKALKESNEDVEKAKEILRTWGKELVNKKKERTTKQGTIKSYIHPNSKVGVLLDIRCESDFVAKSKEFQELSHEICLQIAAMKPLYVNSEEISEEEINKERNIYEEQFKDLGKPQEVINGIVEGKLEKYKKEVCLLDQLWVKDQTKNIKDLITEYISKTEENIEVERFIRYEI